MEASAEFLSSNNIDKSELLRYPKCLLVHPSTFSNRFNVLQECHFIDIQLTLLYRFIWLMNRNIEILKANNYIANHTKVADYLATLLDVPIALTKELDEKISMKSTRKIIIGLYLKERLGMTNQDIVKLWKIYPSLTHKSLTSIVDILQLLQNQIGFTRDKIVKNGFLTFASSDNMKKILAKFPTIGGKSVKEILLKNPKIAMQKVESIEEILAHLKKFDIPEDRILKCEEVLTLSPATVYERIEELKKVEQFNVLFKDLGILKLITHQNRAKARLEFLNQNKIKCASLNILSNSTEIFRKYVKSGKDRTNGSDQVNFLSKKFNLDRDEIHEILNRHPYWRYVPVVSIQVAVTYLESKGFTDQDCLDNLCLLLYPLPKIDQKLNALVQWKFENVNRDSTSGKLSSDIGNNKLLSLCLYFIESEFNFSGNGIWDLDRQDAGKQDIVSTNPPEIPEEITNIIRRKKKQ